MLDTIGNQMVACQGCVFAVDRFRLPEGEAALVREIEIVLEDWVARGELASDFAVRLLQYFRKHGDQGLKPGAHLELRQPPKTHDENCSKRRRLTTSI
jgi:hypothetical protein